MKKGIDISYWQGNVDFSKVAKQIDFIILREGYRSTRDEKFLQYVEQCKKYDINIHGVYHFIYATSEQMAVAEAMNAVANVKKAGLSKDTIIYADLEYDSINKAKVMGVTIGKKQINDFTRRFCETIVASGYKTGIYTNIDFHKNYYEQELLNKYPVWLADYTGGPDFPCVMQQYTSSGSIAGISGKVDMNYCFYDEFEDMVDDQVRERNIVLDIMRSWVGKKESDGSHHVIVDEYNKIVPLPVGYKLKYVDSWCAGTVSAAYHKAGYDGMFPLECSCPRMIEKAKQMGVWQESDSYVPAPADCVLYDWQDSGIGDNAGNPDHIGMVEKVAGNVMTIIEGNYDDQVKRRSLAIDGKYIRGYIVPKFTSPAPVVKTTSITLNKKKKWKGKVTATELNVRTWAGTNFGTCSFSPLKKGNRVNVCDSMKAEDGSIWYYIKRKGKYGFVHSSFVKKVAM